MPLTRRYLCEYAHLGGEKVARSVLVEVAGDRIVGVEPGAQELADTVRLRGLTLPGFANTHSHAFHRALRGRSEAGRGDFWSWRDQMYRLAAALDPDRYHRLAVGVFAEMALAGFTTVGEFHYLHHQAGGAPYAAPNAMGEALVEAASAAGVRITLLDTCYLESAPGRPPAGVQQRFSDGDVASWAERASALAEGWDGRAHVRGGAAVHSLRAVPPQAAAEVAGWAAARGLPLHVHVSEQPAENAAVEAAYGATPTAVLGRSGVLGPGTTAVHATHLVDGDVALLAASGSGVCLCPTTERDLADGIGPAGALDRAGVPLSIGTDSHALVDPMEELRAVELDERLASGVRGTFDARRLLALGTAAGHRALGWPEAGRIAEGALADLVTVSLDGPHLAGIGPDDALEQVVFAARPTDVRQVVVSGTPVVEDGRHLLVEDPASFLGATIRELRELGELHGLGGPQGLGAAGEA